MTTRDEHVEWCKVRALEYLERGDCQNALTSMMSDLDKHDETRGHAGNLIAMMMLMNGMLSDPREVRRHIEGYR